MPDTSMATPRREGRRQPPPDWQLLVGAVVLLTAAVTAFFIIPKLLDRPAPPDPNRFSTLKRPESASHPGAAAENLAKQAVDPKDYGLPDASASLPDSRQSLVEEASRIVANLTAKFPDNPNALQVQARLSKWLGKTAEADETWARCLELDPDYAYAHYGLGTLASEVGRFAEAAGHFRRAVDVMPNWAQARIELARSLINLDRPHEAVSVLDNPSGTAPERAESRVLLGRAYTRLEQLDKAKESYQAADRILPGYPEAVFGLAGVCSRLGEKVLAKEYIEQFQQLRALQMEVRKNEMTEFDDQLAGRESLAVVYTDAGRIYFTKGRPQVAEMIWRRAAGLDPSNVECRQSIAWLYRSSDRRRDEIKPLQELAEIQPDNPTYLLEIGRIHLQLNEIEAAERAFRSLSEKIPNHFAGYAALAQLHLRTNRNLPEAIALADKAVELIPTAAHYELLAAACEANGEIAGAIEAIKQAMELSTDAEPYRKGLDLLAKKLALSEAAHLLQKPDAPLPASQAEVWEELNGVSEFLDRAFPDDRDAIVFKARYLAWSGKHAESKASWERCLDLFPEYGGGYFGLGEIALEQGAYAEAAAMFRKSLALGDWKFAAQIKLARALINDNRASEGVDVLEGPAGEGLLSAEGLHVLADAYSQLGKMSQAKEGYQAAIEAEPFRAEAHYRLAIVCTRLGRSEQAREAMARFRELKASSSTIVKSGRVNYDDLLAMRVEDAVFCFRAGNVCNARGRTAEAETLWLRATALDDKHVACRQELVTLYRKLGNNEQAVRWLEELCRIRPDEAKWPLQLGELHASLSQFDAAEKAFRTVCEKMPERFEGYASLAQLYLRADRNPARTLELLKKAVDLDPRPEGYALLGEAQQKNGNLAEATSAWKRAAELEPSNPQYRQTYESLRDE